MAGPTHRSLALLLTAGILLSGCGSTSNRPAGLTSATTSTTSSGPPPMTRADPVALLPMAGQVQKLIEPLTSPNRYDQRLTSSTLASAFSLAVPRSRRLAAGTAELNAVGRNGASLYVHLFEFKSPAGAGSLTSTFLASTRLGTTQPRPSQAPGQQGQASSQPYEHHRAVSYRYAFRDHNVLAYVELDGPRGRYSLADVIRVATFVDRRVRDTLS